MPTAPADLSFLTDPTLTQVDPIDISGATIAQGNGPASTFPMANRFQITPEQMQQMADMIDQDTPEIPDAPRDPEDDTHLTDPGSPPQTPPAAPISPPSTDAPPQAPIPAPDPAAPEGDPAPPVDPNAAGPTLSWKVGDQDITLDTTQAEYLLNLNTWFQNIPDQIKEAWAGIQDGTHAPIPTEDVAAFRAWQALGSPTADSAKPDLSDLDPEQRRYIESLERIAQPVLAPTQPSATPGQQYQPPVEQRAQEIADQQRTIEAVSQDFATRYSLTPEQVSHLHAAAARSQSVARIEQQRRQYSPTGHLISRAPFAEVLRDAFEDTMLIDPTLRSIRDERVYNERSAQTAAADQKVSNKKALAGSLASVTPAAVPSGKTPQGPVTPQQTISQITEYLAEAAAQGTDIQ